MKRISKDWRRYLAHCRKVEHVMADPPWLYDDQPPRVVRQQLAYDLWTSNDEGLRHLFTRADAIGANTLFLWATNPLLEEIALVRSRHGLIYPWPYVTTITWGKQTSKGNRFYGNGNHFRGATEHLLVYRRRGLPPLRTNLRNHFDAKAGKRTEKPKHEERRIIERIGGKWAYLFSGPNVEPFAGLDVDCVDVCL